VAPPLAKGSTVPNRLPSWESHAFLLLKVDFPLLIPLKS